MVVIVRWIDYTGKLIRRDDREVATLDKLSQTLVAWRPVSAVRVTIDVAL